MPGGPRRVAAVAPEEDPADPGQDRPQEGHRARALDARSRAYTRRIAALQGEDHARCRRARRASRPTWTRKRARAVADPGRPAHRARAAGPPAGAAAPRRARSLADAARRALQVRPARPGHRRAERQGLRRPARARGVHRSASPSRTSTIVTRRARREGRRDRDAPTRLGDARAAPAGSRRRDPARAATRSRAVKQSLIDTRVGYARHAARDKAARAAQRPRRAPAARGRARRPQGRSRRRSRRTLQARAPGTLPAGPIKRGSGQLIWPVNGPITSPFCERRAWEACHPGHRHRRPDAARRSAPPPPARVALMQSAAPRAATATSPASSTPARCPRATRTSRASRPRSGQHVSAGPGHRHLRLHRPLLRRRTCTSRCASTARSRTR